MNPIITETDYTYIDGVNVELKGETFPQPFTKTEDKDFYSKISLIEKRTNGPDVPWGVGWLFFQDQLSKDDYKKHFEHIIRNINFYKIVEKNELGNKPEDQSGTV